MSYIFIHGLGQDASSWNETIKCMNNKNHIKLGLKDLCVNAEINYHSLYKGFCEYCLRLSKPLDLCGLSLGAILALNFAIDYPEKVKKLVLISPVFKSPTNLLSIQNTIFSFMPKSAFKSTEFSEKDFINICDSMKGLDFIDSLSNIEAETIVVYGKKDKVNQKGVLDYINMINNVRYINVIGAGHEVNIDMPEKLAIILER